ncbi:unnamed protein product [Rhizophagus irregularis]|uniref:Uncharacterized protein n=1 Tax=Rhizophagus irregularis TaxID=588596 RepID=A0A916ED92_9GLOM|nr:unnamed protein product [Rhizophagus irregularis]
MNTYFIEFAKNRRVYFITSKVKNQFNYEPQSSLRGKRRKRRNRRIPSGNKRTSVPVKCSLFLYYCLKYPGIYFHPG